MLLPKAIDALHKAWMYRVLTAIADDVFLASQLFFKGGTCAAMRGFLERFSVDLDFDLPDESHTMQVKTHLEKAFGRIGLSIYDQSAQQAQYFLKYDNKPRERNTLKVEASSLIAKANEYEAVRFEEIDRILRCQTIETMFANKLIAVKGRYKRNGSVAGRDLFDVHSFIIKGHTFKKEIIEELSGKKAEIYLKELKKFIEKKFTQKDIDEDLNHLLPAEKFKKVRKTLKQEVLGFL